MTSASASAVMSWSGPTDFDTASSYFASPVPVVAGLKIMTAGYAHSHADFVTVGVKVLPSNTTVWSATVPPGAQIPMAVDIVFLPEYNVTGIEIWSSPGQSQTYHNFSPDDLVVAAGTTTHANSQCSDGLDNDLDGNTDYPNDPGCASGDDQVEASVNTDVVPDPQCSDGIDNDLNGSIDYPNDPGCTSYDDPVEVGLNAGPGSCSTVGGLACLKVTPGGVYRSVSVSGVATGVAGTHSVFGSVDLYRFALPTGGSVVLPCVVATVNGTTADPCKTAGGTFSSRVATLVNRSADQPTAGLSGTLATVNVCYATVTTTVAGMGVEDFPAYTIC